MLLVTYRKRREREGLRNAFISDSAIVEPVYLPLERLEAEMQSRGAREEEVSEIIDADLFGEFGRVAATVVGGVGALGEDEEPHGVFVFCEFAEAVFESWLVFGPGPSEEDESVKHHSREPEDWNVAERLFEDDVDEAVHTGGVGYPPEVKPVGVDLGEVKGASFCGS